MTGSTDYYGEARRVSAAMRREGFEENARAFEDAIAAGFTSSEILMALRWHLDRFLEAKPDASGTLRRSAKALHKRIDATLDQSG
jgi:hypothetical protein